MTLMGRYSVTRLIRARILDSVRLIVLDCTGLGDRIPRIIDGMGRLRSRYPRLIMVLVDGAIDQDQLVAAFRQGAHDYFRSPYPPQLLAERINALCRRR